MPVFEAQISPNLARKIGAKTLDEWIAETGELPMRVFILDGDWIWWAGNPREYAGLKAAKRGK